MASITVKNTKDNDDYRKRPRNSSINRNSRMLPYPTLHNLKTCFRDRDDNHQEIPKPKAIKTLNYGKSIFGKTSCNWNW